MFRLFTTFILDGSFIPKGNYHGHNCLKNLLSVKGLSATVTVTVDSPVPYHSGEDSTGWQDKDRVCTSVKIYCKQLIN